VNCIFNYALAHKFKTTERLFCIMCNKDNCASLIVASAHSASRALIDMRNQILPVVSRDTWMNSSFNWRNFRMTLILTLLKRLSLFSTVIHPDSYQTWSRHCKYILSYLVFPYFSCVVFY